LIAFIGLAKAMPLLQSLQFDALKEFFRSLFSRAEMPQNDCGL
jgi:hypothetical protein